MSAFTNEQLDALGQIFQELGKEITERANRDYCCEGSAAVEAVSNVGSVIGNFDPRYAVLPATEGGPPGYQPGINPGGKHIQF